METGTGRAQAGEAQTYSTIAISPSPRITRLSVHCIVRIGAWASNRTAKRIKLLITMKNNSRLVHQRLRRLTMKDSSLWFNSSRRRSCPWSRRWLKRTLLLASFVTRTWSKRSVSKNWSWIIWSSRKLKRRWKTNRLSTLSIRHYSILRKNWSKSWSTRSLTTKPIRKVKIYIKRAMKHSKLDKLNL